MSPSWYIDSVSCWHDSLLECTVALCSTIKKARMSITMEKSDTLDAKCWMWLNENSNNDNKKSIMTSFEAATTWLLITVVPPNDTNSPTDLQPSLHWVPLCIKSELWCKRCLHIIFVHLCKRTLSALHSVHKNTIPLKCCFSVWLNILSYWRLMMVIEKLN